MAAFVRTRLIKTGKEIFRTLTSAASESTRLSRRDRITAAFERANLLRASGQCSQTDQVLAQFQPKIAQEQIREALSLELRGYCKLDTGNIRAARDFANQAVRKASGRATRYQFLQALAEIEAKDTAAAEAVIRAIEREQLPAGQEDESSRKAAQYLSGLLKLALGDAAGVLCH